MSEFIRTIGRCSVNSISFDVYQNQDDSVTVRPSKLGSDFHQKKWIKFDCMEDLETLIENQDESGAALVQKLKDGAFSHIFE